MRCSGKRLREQGEISGIMMDLIRENGILRYSEFLDFLESGEDTKELYLLAKKKEYRVFLRAYLESKRRVEARKAKGVRLSRGKQKEEEGAEQ